MADVAARVGVSRQLVSLVFRGAPGASAATRNRVLQAATELGYQPDNAARLLSSARSHHLGVLFTLRQPFELDLVEHVYPAAEQRGYSVVLGAISPSRDHHQAVRDLLGYRIEALIVIGPQTPFDQVRELGKTPVAVIGRPPRGDTTDGIHVNEARGIRLAIEHLVQLGHRDIVHIDGGDLPGARDRRRGFLEAARRHAIEDHCRVLPGDYTEQSGVQAVEQLCDTGALPTAIVAGNDRCASGVLFALARRGVRIPEDVSVVGYDDTREAALPHIDLTTVRQDAERLAMLAVRAAVERLDTPRLTGRDIVLDPTLVIRGSTGVPRS